MSISVCLCTYRRNHQLGLLLDDLAQQTLLPDEVVVVDNDPTGGAESVVSGRAVPYRLRYAIQPIKNISLTRNRTVELASGKWLAIIDDDERAPPEWLALLLRTVEQTGADGVLGPVRCDVPDNAPRWIRRGDFYATRHHATGRPFRLDRISKGNALLSAVKVKALEGPYDVSLGLTGGEDSDLYCRLVHAGSTLVWCDEALLSEPVEPSRLNARWLLLRDLRGGQDYARHWQQGCFGPVDVPRRVVFFMQAAVQMLLALGLTTLTLPLGRHHAMRWLVKAAANWGKVSSLWGAHYGEYASTAAATPQDAAGPKA